MSERSFDSTNSPAPPDETFTPAGQFGIEHLLRSDPRQRNNRAYGRRGQYSRGQSTGTTVRTIVPTRSIDDISIVATLLQTALRRSSRGQYNKLSASALPSTKNRGYDLLRRSRPGLRPLFKRRRPEASSEGVNRRPEASSEGTNQLGTVEANRHPQFEKSGPSAEAQPIHPSDIRVRLRARPSANLLLFVVDSSGSMGARRRMSLVKGAILAFLNDAYRKRDRVALIVFRGEQAQLVVPPTNSVELAERHLRHVPTGGKTPLTAGLALAYTHLDNYRRRQTAMFPHLIVVTDGRGNVGSPPWRTARSLAKLPIQTLVIDSEQGYVRLGAARKLAQALQGHLAGLDELQTLIPGSKRS